MNLFKMFICLAEEEIETVSDFSLNNFGPVWNFMCQLGLILIFLLLGNLLCRIIPFLRKSFIPSSLVGGALLLGCGYLVDFIVRSCGGAADYHLLNKPIMQVITYHALGIGFVAMSLKVNKKKVKTVAMKAFENGAMTGATYLLQAIVGIVSTIVIFLVYKYIAKVDASITPWKGSGILLPLGFGQGPGNALTWDKNYTIYGLLNTDGSLGLSVASIGFVVASVLGVLYINIYRKQIPNRIKKIEEQTIDTYTDKNEIGDSESVDKFSIQLALVFLAYAGAFGIMCIFSLLTNITNVQLFSSVGWGFNFIWGVITATLIKIIVVKLQRKKVIKHQYINNYQMDRISGFSFDIMIVAGVAAIEFGQLKDYVIPLIVICILGAAATFFYVRFITKRKFKGYEHEAFLANFGTLTGTASNGMILLREIDPMYETPANNIFIKSQFPAMIFVAPLLLLLDFAGGSDTKLYIALAIFVVLFILYNVFILIPKKSDNIVIEDRED